MIVRSATAADSPDIVTVSRAAGLPDADDDYVRLLLETGVVRVAEVDGGVAAWGAARDGVLGSMLTDLFVEPGHQGRGLGQAVLRELWPDPVASTRFTFSSQHAAALPVYARAGLQPVWPLLYLSGPTAALPATGATVATVTAATAAAADHTIAGGDRSVDFEYWSRSGEVIVVREADEVVAVGALGPGRVRHLTGHDHAAAALFAALRAAGNERGLVCLPGPHPAAIPLLRCGFRVVDFDFAMATPDLLLPTTWAYSPALA